MWRINSSSPDVIFGPYFPLPLKLDTCFPASDLIIPPVQTEDCRKLTSPQLFFLLSGPLLLPPAVVCLSDEVYFI